jgi:flagellar motor switch/type III secretory pathway protein FliN
VPTLALRPYKTSEMVAIEKGFGEIVAPWLDAWQRDRMESLTARNVDGNKDTLGNSLAELAAIRVSGALVLLANRDSMARIIFGKEDLGRNAALRGLRDKVVDDCLSDLALLLNHVGSSTNQRAELLRPHFHFGSGWAVITVVLVGRSLVFLLGPELCTRFAGERPVRPPRGQLPTLLVAISDKPLAFGVEIGSTTLTIGQIQNLAVGDVVRLDTVSTQPVSLVSKSGYIVSNGYLGASDTRKAVQLYREN